MKYCLLYDNKSRNLNNADEIILKYVHKTAEIIEHIEKYKQEQRIILNVTLLNETTLLDCKDIFAAAAEKHPNIALLGDTTQEKLQELGIPFFFQNIVDSWDKLNAFIQYGVSDVYIGNEFGFSLKKISKICKENNINVRVYPNVAQSSSNLLKSSMSHFFIRPEDLDYYEEYVDVLEFFGPLDRQDVLYKIYTNKRWLGNLNTLIIGLDAEINNTIFLGCFGQIRTGCEKRCSYSNSCNICNRFLSIDKTIEEVMEHECKTDEVSM